MVHLSNKYSNRSSSVSEEQTKTFLMRFNTENKPVWRNRQACLDCSCYDIIYGCQNAMQTARLMKMKISPTATGVDNILFRILVFWCPTFSSRLFLCIKSRNVLFLLVHLVILGENVDIFASVNVVLYTLLLDKFKVPNVSSLTVQT